MVTFFCFSKEIGNQRTYSVLAHNIHLITPEIAEIAYNEIFIGPVLRKMVNDAPLNIVSILKFGSGTKRIMSGILNTTLTKIHELLPNLIKFKG